MICGQRKSGLSVVVRYAGKLALSMLIILLVVLGLGLGMIYLMAYVFVCGVIHLMLRLVPTPTVLVESGFWNGSRQNDPDSSNGTKKTSTTNGPPT